jgi:hypothetical protein
VSDEKMLYFRWRTSCRIPGIWAADQGFYAMLARFTFPKYNAGGAWS